MKKTNCSRSFLMGMLILMLLIGLMIPAVATSTQKTITVSNDLTIFIDGVEMKVIGYNGEPVESFIYNGTTYVPLRAVSEYLGKTVSWDGNTRRVYIGSIPGQSQPLLSVCSPYQTEGGFYLPEVITMAGKTYTNCCMFASTGFALFNLDGQYQTFSFDVGHVDGSDMYEGTLYIYLDGELAETMKLDSEALPQHRDIPLNGALQMKIQSSTGSVFCTYGMGNMEVK